MLKIFAASLAIIASLLAANVSYADDQQKIHTYIQINFADRVQVSPEQIQKLSLLLDRQQRSFDMDMSVADPSVHIEVPRSLTRLYCLQLLKAGNTKAYQRFIAAQLSADAQQVLSFSSFKKLSKYITKLNAVDYAALESAAITHEDLATNKLLSILFPPQTNFRHMLYTEGGIGMFKNLRTMIKHQYLTQRQIDLWYAYWVINIAGFRGHVMQNGSQYLTEPVYQAMHKLKNLIDIMLDSPNYNPLVPYLEYRAELLGFSNYPLQERLLLAHLGSLMRLYNLEEGRELAAGFMQLPKKQREQLQCYFDNGLYDYEQPTITYLPALFGNTLQLVDNDIEKTVTIVVSAYNKALELYSIGLRNGIIDPSATLSFNHLSSRPNITKLSKMPVINSCDQIKIGADGNVTI